MPVEREDGGSSRPWVYQVRPFVGYYVARVCGMRNGFARSIGGCPLARADPAAAQVSALPRTPDGKPDLQGIWQVLNPAAWDIQDHPARLGVPAGQGVVEGNEIPYQPSALAKKQENFANRLTADPEAKGYLPGVPRIMYMPFPFQIFQTPNYVAMAFEYAHAIRTIYTMGPRIPGAASTGGWATREAAGKGTRWSSMSSISRTRRGSIGPGISTATHYIWSNATR